MLTENEIEIEEVPAIQVHDVDNNDDTEEELTSRGEDRLLRSKPFLSLGHGCWMSVPVYFD